MFVGRKHELSILQNLYDSTEGKLVILFGRRRIGKTELLREFSRGKRTLFYSCTETTDAEQLASFSRMILNAGHPAARYTDTFPDWQTAFLSAAEVSGGERIVLIVDEFPYMARENPEIPSILQNLWDHELNRKNLLLILCGSSLSFMEKEVLSDKRPLYGRADSVIRLRALNYLEAASFFPEWSPEDKIRAYAVLGGIPYYLKQFDSSGTLQENITQKLLTNGYPMYNEVEFMMRQEFREPGTYRVILNAIASGATRLNEISQKTLVPPTSLPAYLGSLMEVGLVEKEISVVLSDKEEGNVQRGLYQLTDPFFRFWFTFVRPYLGELDSGDAAGICNHAVMPQLDYYTSAAFEKVAVQYLRLHKADLPFYFTRIGRWWTKNTELDIAAVSADGSQILGGECKYKNSPADAGDVLHMMKKLPEFKARQVYWCFFSRGGYTEEAGKLLWNYAFTLQDLYSPDRGVSAYEKA